MRNEAEHAVRILSMLFKHRVSLTTLGQFQGAQHNEA